MEDRVDGGDEGGDVGDSGDGGGSGCGQMMWSELRRSQLSRARWSELRRSDGGGCWMGTDR